MPSSVSCSCSDGSFHSTTPACIIVTLDSSGASYPNMYWIRATQMVAGRTTYTFKITGLTNGNMADLTTGYADSIFGGNSFGDCILNDASESFIDFD